MKTLSCTQMMLNGISEVRSIIDSNSLKYCASLGIWENSLQTRLSSLLFHPCVTFKTIAENRQGNIATTDYVSVEFKVISLL
jgi:hypothetical protein